MRPIVRDVAVVWVDRVAWAALVLLAFVLPFELATPVARLGPFSLTSVELPLYGFLTAWALRVGVARRTGWTAVHTAVLAFAAAVLVSAVLAEVRRAEAMKFAARTVGGCVLFAAAADLAASARRRAVVVTALAGGAVVSAAAGLAEMWWPVAAEALAVFKTQPSFVGGWRRASGTFQYANTAAMYWEAALPLTLAVGAWWAVVGRRPLARAAALAAALVLVEALVLSASRAGFWGAAIALGVLVASGWRRVPALRGPALSALAALAVFPFASAPAGALVTLRLQADDPRAWYRAEYTGVPPSLTLSAGDSVTVPLKVRNAGVLAWPAGGARPVSVSYHWFDRTGQWVVAFEGVRSPLPHNVPPRGEATVAARLLANVPPGRYRVKWDLVHEHVAWFSGLGAAMPETEVLVRAPARPVPPPRLEAPFRSMPVVRPPRRALWQAALTLWRTRPLTGIGPDNFRHLWGPYVPEATFDDRLHANSLYVEILATVGLLGFAAMVAVAVLLGRAILRGVRTSGEAADRALALGVGAALLAFFVHGVVDHFLPFTPTYGLFWVLAGLACGAPEASADR